jgi:VIT1/CCC1 family predicted Fe2+/Mn2+ transporter
VAAVSLVSFFVGALLPVIPWLSGSGDPASIASIVIGIVAAAIVGGAIAQQSERPVLRGVARQVAILIVAVAVTYAIGRLVGVNLS